MKRFFTIALIITEYVAIVSGIAFIWAGKGDHEQVVGLLLVCLGYIFRIDRKVSQ